MRKAESYVTAEYFICENCGCTGENDDLEWDEEHYWTPHCWCPECHKSDVVNAEKCMICGEIKDPHFIDGGICEKCQGEICDEVESVIELFIKKACGDANEDEVETSLREFIGNIL